MPSLRLLKGAVLSPRLYAEMIALSKTCDDAVMHFAGFLRFAAFPADHFYEKDGLFYGGKDGS